MSCSQKQQWPRQCTAAGLVLLFWHCCLLTLCFDSRMTLKGVSMMDLELQVKALFIWPKFDCKFFREHSTYGFVDGGRSEMTTGMARGWTRARWSKIATAVTNILCRCKASARQQNAYVTLWVVWYKKCFVTLQIGMLFHSRYMQPCHLSNFFCKIDIAKLQLNFEITNMLKRTKIVTMRSSINKI